MTFLNDAIQFLNGFRKFSVMILLILVGIIFRSIDFINGVEFVDLLKGTAIAFFAANSGEHMTKAVIEWVKSKAKK